MLIVIVLLVESSCSNPEYMDSRLITCSYVGNIKNKTVIINKDSGYAVFWIETDRINETFLKGMKYYGNIVKFSNKSKSLGKVVNGNSLPTPGQTTTIRTPDGKETTEIKYYFVLFPSLMPKWWNIDVEYSWYSIKYEKTDPEYLLEEINCFISKDGKKIFVQQINWSRR